jgi:hypothetical protein
MCAFDVVQPPAGQEQRVGFRDKDVRPANLRISATMSDQAPLDARQQRPRDGVSNSGRRGAYSAGIVATAIVAMLVLGVLLKVTTRYHRTASNPPEHTAGQNMDRSPEK